MPPGCGGTQHLVNHRDFGHNDNFVFLGFCVTWSLSAPWWFLEENLMKEVMIFWGAEMDSSERAGV